MEELQAPNEGVAPLNMDRPSPHPRRANATYNVLFRAPTGEQSAAPRSRISPSCFLSVQAQEARTAL